MSDSLTGFWSLLEMDSTTVTPDLLDDWSPPLQTALTAWNWLRPAAEASFVVCPECGDHWEEPVAADGPDGERRLFIACPVQVRVEVDPSELQQWTVDTASFARGVAAALALTGQPKAFIADRLWRLGRTRWQESSRDVWLSRGLSLSDGPAMVVAMRSSVRPIVLFPDRNPDEQIWSGRVPVLIALSQVSQLVEEQLRFDHRHLVAMVIEQDERSEESSTTVAKSENRELLLRRQIKAEIASMLTDDAFVAAYKEHGSHCKAADAMSIQTGRTITKDAVRRAVLRTGRLSSVAAESSSQSVRRTVVSQRCDGQKKIPNVAEARDWQ